MFIVKFGGSIITEKAKDCCFRQEVMDDLAAQMKRASEKVILVHGAGSFGHILAKQYNLNSGFKKKNQLQGFALTQAQVQRLNNLVLASLQNHSLTAVSIPPHAIITLRNHQVSRFDFSVFEQYLKQGFLPVTFGDVALDTILGFSICSGDLLVELLAVHFKPEKVIFVMDEDGLYTANPKTNPDARFIETATLKELRTLATTSNKHADVTRGMEGKLASIQRIARSGIDTILVNGNIHNRLYDTLKGKNTKHTCILGEEP
jgi:isopentenyl phosphate kinase